MIRCINCAEVLKWPLPSGPAQCPRCKTPFDFTQEGILRMGLTEKPQDYPEWAYERLFPIEEQHFWFQGRNRIILSAIRSAFGRVRGLWSLEVGCGTGQVLAWLERQGMAMTGVDMHETALRFARRRTTAPLVCCDARRLPFEDEFDLVLLCDVIEHAADDLELLTVCAKAAKRGGKVLVTVPAGMWLWSESDVQGCHKRRYDRSELRKLFERSGLQVEMMRYFNSLIAPLIYIYRKPRKTRRATTHDPAAELSLPPRPLNALLRWTIYAESFAPSFLFPWGASLIGIAQRP